MNDSMRALGPEELLRFSKELQCASDVQNVVDLVREEIETTLGYKRAWLYVLDEERPGVALLLTSSGDRNDSFRGAMTVQIEGDAMAEEVIRAEHAVVVDDAQVDPRTNKDIVSLLGNRTIVNVPLRLLDRPLGSIGTGSFGDEGARPPTRVQVDYLVALASHVSVALARIRLAEVQAQSLRERQELERRLSQAQRLESIGVLAGGVAHDFNNMLAVILGQAQRLLPLALDEQQRSGLTAIIDAAGRAAERTKQLLAVGQRQRLLVAPLEMAPYLKRFGGLVECLLPMDVRLEVRIEGHGLFATGDPSQLDHALMNLCINARDAMPEGGKITLLAEAVTFDKDALRTHPWAREGEFVRVAVKDTGFGIPPEYEQRLFEPFFTTKAPGKGTGLGLPVTHGIVRQHGGFLRVESRQGEGSTFSIYLPRGEGPIEPAKVSQVFERGGGEKILVADDERGVREIVAGILRDAGYVTLTAAGGMAALEAARTDHFDLLLLDVIMPDLGGLEVARRLRGEGSSVPIVLSTAYSVDMLQSDTLSRIGAHVLEKPFSPESLLTAVRQALGSRRECMEASS